MDFEEELRRKLRAGVGGAEVDVDDLASGGIERGKRLVHRRRVAQLVAACATLAVVGGVAYAGSWGGAPGTGFDAADGPSVGQPVSAKTDITPQAALKILLELLPPDAKTGSYKGADMTGWKPELGRGPAVVVRLSYTDRAGTSNLSLHVGRFPVDDCLSSGANDTCTRNTLADGSVLTIRRSKATDGTLLRVWSATVNRKDGLAVGLLEDNAEVWKERGTRPTPPLPIERLHAMVTSPRWQWQVDEDFAKQAEKLPVAPMPSPNTSPNPR